MKQLLHLRRNITFAANVALTTPFDFKTSNYYEVNCFEIIPFVQRSLVHDKKSRQIDPKYKEH